MRNAQNKPYVNSTGASYFAVNAFGWATARTPWEAIGKLDLTASGRDPKLGSPKFNDIAGEIQLWYLPNEDDFKGTSCYCPIDKDGNQYGIPLFAGQGEHNEELVSKLLTRLIAG